MIRQIVTLEINCDRCDQKLVIQCPEAVGIYHDKFVLESLESEKWKKIYCDRMPGLFDDESIVLCSGCFSELNNFHVRFTGSTRKKSKRLPLLDWHEKMKNGEKNDRIDPRN